MTAAETALRGRAILLMIAAILCFSLMDASVKGLAPRTGVVPALWVRYAGQMLLVVLLVAPRLRQVARTTMPGLQFARSVLLMGATAFFFTALSLIPISDAAALMSINPVLVTLGAALFLGEKLGPRRIGGIAVAMVGTMIVIRPGAGIITAESIFALCAAVCYASYVLLTRHVGSSESPWTSLFYTGLVGTVILSIIVPFFWVTPDRTAILLMGACILFGTCGQMLLIRAFTIGEAAMLAPFAYCGVMFSMLWGMVFYAEWPGIHTITGALVIAGAGTYVWYRETHAR
ncbi:DMT family transporter [Chachezhania antarctica]|uniref:DMT family transporter n=1 Tax=Chachezhania antarctica TaxID=2340860 RepID=UPI000EAF8931|nr:DMT family transporter [Chachezhania antarctica]|tara:strand:- start:925 stop:1791 length:867 start_codon:yes stop_codon:yes gene_type:complete